MGAYASLTPALEEGPIIENVEVLQDDIAEMSESENSDEGFFGEWRQKHKMKINDIVAQSMCTLFSCISCKNTVNYVQG